VKFTVDNINPLNQNQFTSLLTEYQNYKTGVSNPKAGKPSTNIESPVQYKSSKVVVQSQHYQREVILNPEMKVKKL
jgi:hypothetical protein